MEGYDREREGYDAIARDAKALVEQPPVTGGLKDAAQIPNALTNPAGAALDLLLQYAQKNEQERIAGRRLIEAFIEHQNYGGRVAGFGSLRINYRPANADNLNGVQIVDISAMNRHRVEVFSLVTFPFAAGDGSPNATVIYGGFGRSLMTHDPTIAPTNFDFGLTVGGKIEKHNVRQGLETFSVWSKTPFDAILYVTSGSPDELPKL